MTDEITYSRYKLTVVSESLLQGRIKRPRSLSARKKTTFWCIRDRSVQTVFTRRRSLFFVVACTVRILYCFPLLYQAMGRTGLRRAFAFDHSCGPFRDVVSVHRSEWCARRRFRCYCFVAWKSVPALAQLFGAAILKCSLSLVDGKDFVFFYRAARPRDKLF